MSELDAEARAAIAAILTKHFPDAMLDPVAPHELDIYRAGLERAAKVCEAEAVEALGPGDDSYNMATEHCATAIRALMGPKP